MSDGAIPPPLGSEFPPTWEDGRCQTEDVWRRYSAGSWNTDGNASGQHYGSTGGAERYEQARSSSRLVGSLFMRICR